MLFATAERKRPVVPAAAASKVEPRKPAACRVVYRGRPCQAGPMGFRWVLVSVAAVVGLMTTGARCCSAGAEAPQGGIFRIVFAPPEQLDTMDPARREHAGVLVAARPDLRAADDLPGPGRRHRRISLVPEVAAAPPKVSHGRQDVHVHAQARLPVQRRKARRCPGVRARDQPHAGAGPQVAGHAVHAGHRRRPRGAGGESGERKRSGRARIPPGHPPRATASATSPRARACRSSAPSRRTSRPIRRARRVPGVRPYSSRSTGPASGSCSRAIATTAAPRPHHVDGFSVDLTGSSPADVLDRIEDGRADWGIIPPPLYFSPRPRAHPEVRHRQVAVLRPARLHDPGVHAQHDQPAVSRTIPRCGRRSTMPSTGRPFTGGDPGAADHGPVPAADPAGLPGREASTRSAVPISRRRRRSRAGTCGAARRPSTSPTCRSRSPWARC